MGGSTEGRSKRGREKGGGQRTLAALYHSTVTHAESISISSV